MRQQDIRKGLILVEDISQDIKSEAQELIIQLSPILTALIEQVSNGNADDQLIHALFRCLHTLKSLSQMAELTTLGMVLHCMEDKVDLLRENPKRLSMKDIDAIVDVQDFCEKVYDQYPLALTDELIAEGAQLYEALARKTVAQIDKIVTNEDTHLKELEKNERESYDKYLKRSENLIVITAPTGVFESEKAILDSPAYDILTRACDVFVIRQNNKKESFLLLASELEAFAIESLCDASELGLQVKLINKVKIAEDIPQPWSQLFLTNNNNSKDIHTQEDTPVSKFEEKQSSQLINEKFQQNKSEDIPIEEDFDLKNLGGKGAFEIPELDPEMLQDFLQNADELLETLSQSMLELEQDPSHLSAIESIFRSAHTIKGTAGMFGFRAIERMTHMMENLFDRIRKNTLNVSSGLMDALLFALDRVRVMFEEVKKGQSAEIPINDAIAKLNFAVSGNPLPVSQNPIEHNSSQQINKTEANLVSTISKAISQVKPKLDSIDKKKEEKHDDKKKNEKQTEAIETIRVDLRRLDSLVNLVGELVIDRTRFARIEEELRNRNANSELCHLMSESVLLFGRHMNEVQSIIMKIRMVPVGNAFYKFTRVVRDLARQIGKEIDLVIQGGETELDKTLVEEIGDPLVHLIRNSVDHGIETPEIRVENNKTRKGTIHLKAFQDGNMIVISVADDGRGLQVDKIRAKGLSNGLIKEADHLTDKEVFNLIFEPGFSTAEAVTNISGRGVGMDVVKKNIVKLKGIIELDSKVGFGTTTTIKLPLTLAIIPSLMVETYGESYAIPLVNVIESIRIRPDEIQKMGSADFVKLRDRVLPILKLADVFELNQMQERLWYSTDSENSHGRGKTPSLMSDIKKRPSLRNSLKRPAKARIIFVVVGVGEKRVGIIVDQLLGQQEIVIKPIGKIMGKQEGIAGGCVLGNGRVALVMDVGEIIDEFTFSTKNGGVSRAI